MLLDQRRARNAASGAEIGALVDRARDRLGRIGDENLASLPRLWRAARAQGWKRELRALADQRQAHVDHLDRLIGRMVRVALVVQRVERRADHLAVAGQKLLAR